MTLPEAKLSKYLHSILERVETTLDRAGDRFPYFTDPETGQIETTRRADWCAGHWVGLLWLADYYRLEDNSRFETAARHATDVLHESLPSNSMFYGMNHYYAGFRAYDLTGDRRHLKLGLDGAEAMVDNFHEGARQVPLGEMDITGPSEFRGPESEHGPAGSRIGAVDNIYTSLQVLWRAYRETGDNQFRDTAISHADRHLDWYIRNDGSTWHHSVFEPDSGTLERQYNELAYSDETCWARGQGWNIAGLARAYDETGAERYLDALEQSVEYYVANSPDDLVPEWDFEVPTANPPRDTSAAALSAYGLLLLSSVGEREDYLRSVGKEILASLVESYLVTEDSDHRYGAVLHGCFNKPGNYATDHELLWTQYYLAFTLHDHFRPEIDCVGFDNSGR